MPLPKPFAPPAQLYVGIDIAAKTFTASWLTAETYPSKPRTFDQTPAGFAKLHTALTALAVPPTDTLIVLEATGSYVRRITARAIPPAGRMGSEGHPWVNN